MILSLKFPHTVYSSLLYSLISDETFWINLSSSTLISMLIGILGNFWKTSLNNGIFLSSGFSVPQYVYPTNKILIWYNQFMNMKICTQNVLKNWPIRLHIHFSTCYNIQSFNRKQLTCNYTYLLKLIWRRIKVNWIICSICSVERYKCYQ